MYKIIIAAIFIFLVIGIISVSLWYKNYDESLGSLYLKKNIVEPTLLSIREIDLISAKNNYYFTALNKIN
jgi:hypothetical protein